MTSTSTAVSGDTAGPGKTTAGTGGFKTSRHYRTYVKYRFVVGFLAIPLGLYAVFVISPFLQTFYYSLTDWTGLSSDFKFVGFDNFRWMWDDDVFWASVRHNIILALVVPLITLAIGLFLAFMLSAGGRHRGGQAVTGVAGSKVYKILFFFPQALSIAVIAALWGYIFDPGVGLASTLLPGPLDPSSGWLGDPEFALWAVVVVMCWAMVGFYVVLFSAAMGQIPMEIYESALLDGASRTKTFFKITLPLIRDAVQTGWVYLGIMAFGSESFAVVNIITAGPGGPDNSTTVLGVEIWNTGTADALAGRAAAEGVALFVITMVFAVVALSIGRRRDRVEF